MEMKYIYERESVSGYDDVIMDFETYEEAFKYGDSDWWHLTESEKKKIKACFVLESVNPDVDAENHLDGNPVYTWK